MEFWVHIINQSGNALLASQSEEVTSSLQFLVVDTTTDLYQHSTVAVDWSVLTRLKIAVSTLIYKYDK